MSLEADLLDAAELGPLLDEVVLPQAAKVMVANNAAPTVINFFIFFLLKLLPSFMFWTQKLLAAIISAYGCG
jgi:hypothetical protein